MKRRHAAMVELHCSVQINSPLRHYGRSSDLAVLRGQEGCARDKGEMRDGRRWNGQIRWAQGGIFAKSTNAETSAVQKVSIREVTRRVTRTGHFLVDNPIKVII